MSLSRGFSPLLLLMLTSAAACQRETGVGGRATGVQRCKIEPRAEAYYQYSRPPKNRMDSVTLLVSPKLGLMAWGSDDSARRHLRDSAPDSYDAQDALSLMEVQEALAELGFGARFTGECDEQTAAAVREFEAARGLPVTGNPFTPATLLHLSANKEALDRRNELPSVFGLKGFLKDTSLVPAWREDWRRNWMDGIVVADGALHEGSDSIQSTAVHIECRRRSQTCTVVYATGDQNSLSASYSTFSVTRWDQADLIAETEEGCYRAFLTLTRLEQLAALRYSRLSQQGICRDISSPLKEGRIVFLQNEEEGLRGAWRGNLSWLYDSLYHVGPRVKGALKLMERR